MTINVDLNNKVALVTGASSGIGKSVSEAFAKNGCKVYVNYPPAEGESAASALVKSIKQAGYSAGMAAADVSQPDQVNSMISDIINTEGHIDILVNNAGIARAAPIHKIALEEWRDIMDVHVLGTFLCTKAALPIMYKRNRGRIINTASQLAYKGAPGFAHYTAAKGAIISFTRSLALEIGERDITANCVAPGATLTPILKDVPNDMLEEIRKAIPRGKIADVDEIVGTYLFLACDSTTHFRGQCLSPNGGDVFL